jgi:hypothetical protein
MPVPTENWRPGFQEFCFDGGSRAASPPLPSMPPPVDDLSFRLKGRVEILERDQRAFQLGLDTQLKDVTRRLSLLEGRGNDNNDDDDEGEEPMGNESTEKVVVEPPKEADFEPRVGMTVWEKHTWRGPYVLVQTYQSPHKVEVPVNLPGQPDNHFQMTLLEDTWIVRNPRTQQLVVKPTADLTDKPPPKGRISLALAKLTPIQLVSVVVWIVVFALSAAALLRTLP